MPTATFRLFASISFAYLVLAITFRCARQQQNGHIVFINTGLHHAVAFPLLAIFEIVFLVFAELARCEPFATNDAIVRCRVFVRKDVALSSAADDGDVGDEEEEGDGDGEEEEGIADGAHPCLLA